MHDAWNITRWKAFVKPSVWLGDLSVLTAQFLVYFSSFRLLGRKLLVAFIEISIYSIVHDAC